MLLDTENEKRDGMRFAFAKVGPAVGAIGRDQSLELRP